MLRLLKLAQELESIDLHDEAEEVKKLIADDEIDWEKELGQTTEPDVDDESKFFGDWVSDLPLLHEAVIKRRMLMKGPPIPPGFEPLGEGAFRSVYGVKDQNFVVKLAKSERSALSNKSEHETQTMFKGLFPKVYLHGKGMFGTDYDWMVVDKVRVIKDLNEFDSFFKVSSKLFPDVHISFIMLYIGGYMDSLMDKKGRYSTPPIQEIIEKNMQDPLFYRILKASEIIGFEIGDIRPGNVGVDSEGNFVIIDALFTENM